MDEKRTALRLPAVYTDGDLTLATRSNPKPSLLSELKMVLIAHTLFIVAFGIIVLVPVYCVILGKWYLLLGAVALYLPSYLDGSESRLGRPWAWFQNWDWVWGCTLDYFPIALAREGPAFDPKRQYMFCFHPHGAIGWSRVPFMVAPHYLWEPLFPGLKFRILSASVMFRLPVFREVYLAANCVDASKKVAVGVLRNHRKRTGNDSPDKSGDQDNSLFSLFLTPGGIAEQMETQFGRDLVWVNDRHGFIRLAIEQGVSLVPIYAFGEINTYHTIPLFGKFCRWISRKFQFSAIFPYGRGFSLMPCRAPITIVLGRPIPVVQNSNPTPEEIHTLHVQYVEALTKLYNTYRTKFGGSETLTIF